MYTSTVTQTGQITIPAPLRRGLGFEPGAKVAIVETDDGVEIRPLGERYFERFAGMLSGEGNATHFLVTGRESRNSTTLSVYATGGRAVRLNVSLP